MPPSSTVQNVKEEVALALNDTSDPPREVKADDVTLYKHVDGRWRQLTEEQKEGKRTREATLEELDIRGIGSGSTVDGEGETLVYTINIGLQEERTVNIEPYPRDE